jgi:hypothetical protein
MVNSKTLTQLPTLWCIKDCKEVTAWAAKTFNCANVVYSFYLHVDMGRYPDRSCYSFEPKRYSDHTEISLEDFKRFVLTVESDRYSFPKNWAIKVTEENQSTLKEWVESRPDFDKAYVIRCNHLKEGYYVVSDRYDGSYQLWIEELEGFCHMFSEITFDQFKKHVLKQNQEPVIEKKLIGYILKNKEMYTAASIIAFKNVGGTYYWAEGRPDNRDTVITPLREAGVLDLWFEPVYDEVDPWKDVKYARYIRDDIQMGFTKDKIYRVRPNCSIDSLFALYDDCGTENEYFPDNRKCFEPSSKEEYTYQVIEEAEKRFGLINEGDRFDCSGLKVTAGSNVAILISRRSFEYYEEGDRLELDGFILYSQGKWVKRVKPTVEFDNVDAHSKGLGRDGQWYLTVTFKMNNVDPKPKVKEMVQRWAKEQMVESLRNLVDSKS